MKLIHSKVSHYCNIYSQNNVATCEFYRSFHVNCCFVEAVATLGLGPNLQVLFAIGCIELATWEKTFLSSSNPGNQYFLYLLASVLRFVQLSSQKHISGDFGFDGGYLKGKSDAQINDLKLKEIKNGRLAMIAFIGQVVQMLANDFAPTL